MQGATHMPLTAAERRHHASLMRLEQEAQLEYGMLSGGGALQVIQQWLPGGLALPGGSHPAVPHIRACMSGRGCQLALVAAVVAAVCTKDGGASYGIPLHALVSAHGGFPLAMEAAELHGAWGGEERSWAKLG